MSKPESTPSIPESSAGLGCLVRLAWALVGHGIILLSLVYIFERGGGRFALGAPDAVFWAAVMGCLGVRYLDISHFAGRTATGQPATSADWRRYAVILVVVAAVLWGGAHVLARFVK